MWFQYIEDLVGREHCQASVVVAEPDLGGAAGKRELVQPLHGLKIVNDDVARGWLHGQQLPIGRQNGMIAEDPPPVNACERINKSTVVLVGNDDRISGGARR